MNHSLLHILNHKKNSLRYLMVLLLIAVMIFNSVLPFSQKDAFAAQTKNKKTSTGPAIPFGKDISNYSPTEDGYYAYLPVRYEVPHETVEITKQDQETTNSYIPILCFQNTVYIQTDILDQITELFCSVYEDNIQITWFFNTRRLNMTIGSSEATYEEGYLSASLNPLVELHTSAIGTPIKMGDDVYVPMDTVFRIFGMDPTVYEDFYWFKQPQVNAIDVLARLYDSADKDSEFSGKQYFILPSDSASAALGATIADTYYGLATFDPETWKLGLSNFVDDEAIYKHYYKQITDDLLSMDSENSRKLNAMAIDGLDISLSAVATAIGSDADSVDIPSLISALEDCPLNMPDYEYTRLMKQLKRAQYIQKGIKNYGNYVGIGADVLFALINNLSVYVNADYIAVNGIGTILSDDYKEEAALSDGERTVLQKKYNNLQEEGNSDTGWLSKLGKSITGSTDDAIVSIGQTILDTYFNGGVWGPTSLALKVTNYVANAVGLKTVDNAEEYMKAFFAPFLIYRFGKGLYYSQRTKHNASLSNDDLREQISLAYIYLRTCRLEDEYIIGSENYDDKSVSTCQSHINVLDQLLAVLVRDYSEYDELLPDTAFDRAKSLSDSKSTGVLSDLSVPLYFYVFGTVLEKNEDETPVTDAECHISYNGEEIASFSESSKYGDFDVNIPIYKPDGVKTSIEDIGKIELSMKFTSPSVDGAASVNVPFHANSIINLGNIYLEKMEAWKEYYRKFVLEKEYLSSGQTYTDGDYITFSLHDFERDGVPELIIYNNGCMADSKFYIYTYKEKDDIEKVEYVGDMGYRNGFLITSSSASFTGIFYQSGNMDHYPGHYYTIENGKVVDEYVLETIGNYNHKTGIRTFTDEQVTSNNDLFKLFSGIFGLSSEEVREKTAEKGLKWVERYHYTDISSMGWDSFLNECGY